MDILAALNDTSPQLGPRRCKLAVILAEIPDDTPGKQQLLDAVDNARSYPASRLTLTFTALGMPCSRDMISDHRAQRCRCYR